MIRKHIDWGIVEGYSYSSYGLARVINTPRAKQIWAREHSLPLKWQRWMTIAIIFANNDLLAYLREE